MAHQINRRTVKRTVLAQFCASAYTVPVLQFSSSPGPTLRGTGTIVGVGSRASVLRVNSYRASWLATAVSRRRMHHMQVSSASCVLNDRQARHAPASCASSGNSMRTPICVSTVPAVPRLSLAFLTPVATALRKASRRSLPPLATSLGAT
jgi:hypothetical protein